MPFKTFRIISLYMDGITKLITWFQNAPRFAPKELVQVLYGWAPYSMLLYWNLTREKARSNAQTWNRTGVQSRMSHPLTHRFSLTFDITLICGTHSPAINTSRRMLRINQYVSLHWLNIMCTHASNYL